MGVKMKISCDNCRSYTDNPNDPNHQCLTLECPAHAKTKEEEYRLYDTKVIKEIKRMTKQKRMEENKPVIGKPEIDYYYDHMRDMHCVKVRTWDKNGSKRGVLLRFEDECMKPIKEGEPYPIIDVEILVDADTE